MKTLAQMGVAAFLFMLGIISAAASPRYVLKFATLAPQGTAWMNVINTWAAQVAKDSDGQLTFKLYPGGVFGDEPDMLREIRFGELQGGAFTGHGVGEIYSPARVLEIPFLFHHYAGWNFVRAKLMPQIRDGFSRHGFVLLGFMDTGFIRLFSRVPIRSLAQLRTHHVWLWQGDPLAQAFFDASGIPPVPLAFPDVYLSLSTGLIDTVAAPPLAAIALQWFTKTPYMNTLRISNGVGALVVTRQFFDTLPPDLQALLVRTGKAAGKALRAATRAQSHQSLAALKSHGVTFLPAWTDESPADLAAIRNRAAAALARTGYIPAATYAEARQALSVFRDHNRVKR
ncbi:MAG: TRAP transporter substrate-binding protein DctP [Acidiferrobacterales bacterium]